MTGWLSTALHYLETHPAVVGGLTYLIAAYTGAITISILIDAWKALRAKTHLHKLLLSRATRDAELRTLLFVASTQKTLDASTVELAQKEIEAAANELGPRERRLIQPGLKQSSKVGRERYVRGLLTAA